MKKKSMVRFGHFIGAAVLMLSALIMGLLLKLNLRFITEIISGDDHIRIELSTIRKNTLLCLVFAALMIFVRVAADRRSDARGTSAEVPLRTRNILLAVCTALLGVLSIGWVLLLRGPVTPDDTGTCYSLALSVYHEGLEQYMMPGGYLERYPHQYGVVSMDLLSFALGGEGNVLPFRLFNVLMLLCAYAAGAGLVRILERRYAEAHGQRVSYFAEPLWLILGLLNLPSVWYVNYLYGEIASLAAMLITSWALASYARDGRLRFLIPAAASVVLGVLLRKNTIIFLLAASIALLLHALLKKQWKSLLVIAVLWLCATLPMKGLQILYSQKTGVPISEGIPMELFIVMGVSDEYRGPGWYTDYTVAVYNQNGYDPQVSREIARENLRETAALFRADPALAKDFYLRKTISQWTDPTYEGLFYCMYYDPGLDPRIAHFLTELAGGAYTYRVLKGLEGYQLVVYAGIFLCALLSLADTLRKWIRGSGETEVLLLIPWITLIGGFLFTLLWEAKSRYTIEYVYLLTPMACMGYLQLGSLVSRILRGKRVRGGAGSTESNPSGDGK